MRVERSVRISDGYMHVAFTIGGSSLIMNFHEDPEGKVLVYLPARPFLTTYKNVGGEDLEGVMRLPMRFLPSQIDFSMGSAGFYFPINGEVKTTLVKLTKVVLKKVQSLCAVCEKLERERNLSGWIWEDATWEVSSGMIERKEGGE